MFSNYFKIAWRNLVKHKLFSLINIFGLAAGMVICMLALIKIKGAYDYDTFHPDAARSYRIITQLKRKGDKEFLVASSPLPLSEFLKSNKQVENSACLYFSSGDVKANGKSLYSKQCFAGADFYKIFGFQLLSGSPATTPQTVVLTSETAKRFFGTENPVGKRLTLGSAGDFIITGVLAKPPSPSHLRFDLVASLPPAATAATAEAWSKEAAGYTYIKLKKDASKQSLEKMLADATAEAGQSIVAVTDQKLAFQAQPLNAISPAMKKMYNITDEPIFLNLVAFAGIGGIILLLAFFNYINLTLARSLDRAREVGIRKTAGALRYQLITQFLSESVLTAFLAFMMALLLLKVLYNLPTIQRLTGEVAQDGILWAVFAVFTLITGLLAGWIPAQVLSRFQPVRVLKGKFNAKLFGGAGLRKTLTVAQFVASLSALIMLSAFYWQSRYMATAEYGFNREDIVTMPVDAPSYERVAAAYAGVAGVEQVSATSDLFGFSGGDNRFITREEKGDSLAAAYFSVTPSFIHSMGLKFKAGGNLPVTNTNRAGRFVVLNEEACRALGFENAADAIGKQLRTTDSAFFEVAGVVADFHYAGFLRFIRPLMLVYNPAEFRMASLKISAGATKDIVPKLEAVWKELYPHQPSEMKWFDKQLYEQHWHEDDLVFIGLLTGMAISIACLGLLGMVIYTTKNRLKEVSIRKVMGAAVWQIMMVVSKEFFVLLAIATCIGLPIGFMLGLKFLQQYAYRIPFGFNILLGCAALLFCLGGITIGWQTYRAAVANPVKSLRTE